MSSSLTRMAGSATLATMRRHPSMMLRRTHPRPAALALPPIRSTTMTAAIAAGRARPSSSSSSSSSSPSSSPSRAALVGESPPSSYRDDRSVRIRPSSSPRIAVARGGGGIATTTASQTSSDRRSKEGVGEDSRSSPGHKRGPRDASGGSAVFGGPFPVRRSGEMRAGGLGGGGGGGGGVVKSKFEDASGGDGLDDRARAKLAALATAKEEAQRARESHDYDAIELRARRELAGRELARAYSQAIKYASRLTRSESATRVAARLMHEWMDAFTGPLGGSTAARLAYDDVDDDGEAVADATYLNRKWTVRTAHEIAERLSASKKLVVVVDDVAAVPPWMPPPSRGDYVNLLRAFSASKARSKGLRCEALMGNMMTLADAVSRRYGGDVDEVRTMTDDAEDFGMEWVASGDGGDEGRTERWRTWVKESIPNSKVFALAIKCHAGSTRPESLERIILLNRVHDGIYDCCRPHIPGLFKDDPYVLFHSIKALKNFHKEEEYNLGKEWLGRLHGFVTSADNGDYFGEEATAAEDVDWNKDRSEDPDRTADYDVPAESSAPTMDVTSAYTTVIRLMARLRGASGAAGDARTVLDRMHAVRDTYANILGGTEGPGATHRDATTDVEVASGPSIRRKRIASIDIRSNAYNLLLGLYKDSRNAGDATRAIELLQRMVDSGRKAPEDRAGVPLPTEVSFEYAITSISNMPDGVRALDEAERLIELMQDQEYIGSSVVVYNAFIVVCNRQLFGKPELFDKALGILDRMDEMGKTNPVMLPNPETLALVMKSCALSEHKDHKKVLETASNLFLRMKDRETDEKSNVALTDRAYYYMMKCVDMYSSKSLDQKVEQIQELFSEACQRGLCSANVLACFRSCVSDEDYRLTVGKGRLADHWIANIKGPRALYTDGSKGGVGKNARRKGKSTSDWARKTKAKEIERESRKNDKRAKKSLKKVMNSIR